MKKNIWLSIIVFCLFNSYIWAFSGAGTGTQEAPYQIINRSQLQEVNNDLTAHYILMNDIDLSSQTYDKPLIASGIDANTGLQAAFSGHLDGNGYKITGLNIVSDLSYSGLIGMIDIDGKVSDIKIENFIITCTSSSYMGALCGYNKGTIQNCSSSGIVEGYYCSGGLCGYNEGKITSSTFTGSVTGQFYTGGLCGYNYGGSILNCYSNATVNGDLQTGGLAGKNREEGVIENSCSTGTVTGANRTGGLCGENLQSSISNCYSHAHVSGTSYTGGLIGENEGRIIASYSVGEVSGELYVGGLCGSNEGVTINSFWDTQTSKQTASNGGIGKTTYEMKQSTTFLAANWQIADLDHGLSGWYFESNNYPMLSFQYPSIVIIPDTSGMNLIETQNALSNVGLTWNVIYLNSWRVLAGNVIGLQAVEGGNVYANSTINILVSLGRSGTGSSSSPYSIAGAKDLEYINNVSNKNFVLVADIYLSKEAYEVSLIDIFSGTLDGQGFTINNLRSAYTNVHLFRHIGSFGKVLNLGLKYCKMADSILTRDNDGTVKNCYATGSITSSYVNYCGFIGKNYGQIISCFSELDITIDYGNTIGGLCGQNSGIIRDCYSKGSIVAEDHLGGLCGSNNQDIYKSYSTTSVKGDYKYGGLCGYSSGTISSCFWDIETSLQTTSAGGVGKTTSQMQTQGTFTAGGWDFVNETANGLMDTWYMAANDYPALYWQANKGDINCDGSVNQSDLSLLTWFWLDSEQIDQRLLPDMNRDGIVDTLDYALFAGQW